MIVRTLVAAVALLALCAAPATAQGRLGPAGVSVAQRVPPPLVHRVPRPEATAPFRARNAAEASSLRRAYRQELDGSAVRPQIPSSRISSDFEARVNEGRSTLDPARAGAFARSGPAAIGRSSVTRPALGTRR